MSSVLRVSLATALLFGAAFSAACNDDKAADTPAESPRVAESPPAPASQPLAADDVPTEILEGLEGMNLESAAPCSDTIATLRPALESITASRLKLAAATTEAEVVQLLTALSSDLSARLPSIAARTETDELRRISAELSASVGDLAESLKLASTAMTARDKDASSKVQLRLQNGVTNTRSSIERLIDQCAF